MRQWLLLLLKGALIGVGGILPGISGGVLCVTLGVYQPLMALLAHPIRELKARMGFFIPLVIGVALGVLGLSRLVNWLFVTSPVPAVWLFIGLIAGTVPSLWREAGERGRGAGALLTGGLTFLVALAALLLWSRASIRLSPNPWVWLLCGALWGLGVILPGLSPSSLFVFLGVYQPMTAGVADPAADGAGAADLCADAFQGHEPSFGALLRQDHARHHGVVAGGDGGDHPLLLPCRLSQLPDLRALPCGGRSGLLRHRPHRREAGGRRDRGGRGREKGKGGQGRAKWRPVQREGGRE